MRFKYRNRPTEYRGELYPSQAEARRAMNLDLLQRAGTIAWWRRGERHLILDGGTGRRVYYTPDFVACDATTGVEWAEDVKGAVPRDFRIRAILFEQRTGMALRVVDSDGNVKWSPNGKRGGQKRWEK